MKIKRLTLILLIIFSMVVGSFATVLVIASGVGNNTLLTTSRYKEYLEYLNDSSDLQKIESLKNFLLENYYIELDEDELMEDFIKGSVSGLGDIYTEYIPSDELEEYMESLLGTSTYYGVGITFLKTPMKNGYYVMAVNTKGPAFKAGVRKGDIIYKVNDELALDIDPDDVSSKIKGPIGTTVKLEMIRQGGSYTVEIERQEIATESVVYEYLDEYDVAYIQISQFIDNTDDDFKEALQQAEQSNAKGLIIDLRDNGGGLVDACVSIADMLMEKGVVVTATNASGAIQQYTSSAGRTKLQYALLVNGNSASASEILAAGIKDNKEGIIVGTQTYGKGIIQTTKFFSDGSALKYTVYQYVSPNGNEIHKVGITPDYIVELGDECYDEYGILVDDVQLTRAIELLLENK